MKQDEVRYKDYLFSDAWRQKRRQVIARAGGRCERCKCRPVQEVHHKTYDRLGNERLDDLEGLCQPCHREEHGGRRKRARSKSRKECRKKRERERTGYPERTPEEQQKDRQLLALQMKRQAAKIDKKRKKFGYF